MKYKKRRKGREKFCETYCGPSSNGGTGFNNCRSNKLADNTFSNEYTERSFGLQHGVLVKYDGELYYPPITVDGSDRLLYATDLVNLGAVFDCDWQGFPKIIQYLTDTSYKIPPLVQESPEQGDPENTYVTGMIALGSGVGLFYDIDCNGLHFGSDKAQNIRRQCELNVDVVEGSGTPPSYVGINQIYDTTDPTDTLNSINRYIRNSFCLLNINGPEIGIYPPISAPNIDSPYAGTSFNVSSGSITSSNNGMLYMQFRNFIGSNPMEYSALNNSFYMYFGVVPGKTALKKLNSKYFLPCERVKTDDFIIDTTVTNTTFNGATNGSIMFNIVGGTAPYTYTLVGTNTTSYNFGPATTTYSATISGLMDGSYELTVTDSLGTIVVKEITVSGPPGLACNFSIEDTPSSQIVANGSIRMIINGGRVPYNVTATLANGQIQTFGPYSTSVNQLIPNIPFGTNTFVVTDSDTPQGRCASSLMVDAPPPVSLQIVNVTNDRCSTTSCQGGFQIRASGGTSPYTVEASSTNTFSIAAGTTIDSARFQNLCKGVYTVTVTDSNGQTATQTTTILKPTRPLISVNDPSINNLKQCNPNYTEIKFKINPCSPGQYEFCAGGQYTLTSTIDGLDYTDTTDYQGNPFVVGINTIKIPQPIYGSLELSISDSKCGSNVLFIPATQIERPTSTLNGSYAIIGIDHKIRYSATGGIPPYTFSPVNSAGGDIKTFPSAGVYTGIVKDSVGCTDTITLIVP